jgi:hypothetical protein
MALTSTLAATSNLAANVPPPNPAPRDILPSINKLNLVFFHLIVYTLNENEEWGLGDKEGGKMLKKLLGIVLAVFLLGLIFGSGYVSYAQEQDIVYAAGYISPTPEEYDFFVKTHPKIIKVLLNERGLERINAVRRAKGLSPLTTEGVASIQGDDLISALPGKAPRKTAATAFATPDSLPPSVDNSQLPAFPPVRDRGAGSCIAYAATYYQMTHMAGLMYGWDNKNENNNTKFSPQWTFTLTNDGAIQGTGFYDTFNIMEGNGAVTWAEFPPSDNYKAWCMDQFAWERAINYRINPIQIITDVDTAARLDQLKALLSNGYIVSFGTYIMGWQWADIKDDPSTQDDDAFVGQGIAYYAIPSANSGHAMDIVGYNDAIWCDINNNGQIDSGEKGALLIVNSSGTSWTNGGFAWVAYDALKQVSGVSGGPSRKRIPLIDFKTVYVMTLRDHYQPKLLAKFTVNHAKRKQLRVNLGISDTAHSAPTVKWYPGALSLRGGDYAFNGTTVAVDGTFVLDFTDILIPPGNTQTRCYLSILDSTAGSPATLKSFKLLDKINNSESQEALSNNIVVDAGEQTVNWDYTFYPQAPIITNNPPVAVAFASPLSGTAPLDVHFTGAGTDSDGTLTDQVWVFGPAMLTNMSEGSITPVANYQYTTPGTYSAKFTVKDDDGAESSDAVLITVTKKGGGGGSR